MGGVEKNDVDVTVEDDFLIVRGTRRRRRRLFPGVDDDEPKPAVVTRKYRKKIAFVESEVDIDQMEATFENGVLVISAPKRRTIRRRTSRSVGFLSSKPISNNNSNRIKLLHVRVV